MKHAILKLLMLSSMLSLAGCSDSTLSGQWVEQQITFGPYGHFLNPVQSFSSDGEWLLYDTRNEDPDIGKTGRIERVNLRTGLVDTVYQTSGQSEYGPGVGAVACSPADSRIIFIHGLAGANARQPYGITRRSGKGLRLDQDGGVMHYDARDPHPPFTPGALRGGSHAHSWSGDGRWISFTYNDEWMAQLSHRDSTVQDLRMVGVMTPWKQVNVEDTGDDSFSGEMFSMIVTKVTELPTPGSDEISKAYEDGWIGRNGYIDDRGVPHPRAIAFLGDVRDDSGNLVTEVFVVDLPEEMPDLTTAAHLAGHERNRPQPLPGVEQRRLTFTTDRKFPGVQGPRQWMKSSPDGADLYFMMKDDAGIVQVYSIPTVGGVISQRTHNDFSIETSFDIAPDGGSIVYGAGQQVFLTDLSTGKTICLTPEVSVEQYSDLRGIQWSRSGQMLAYNRKVHQNGTAFFQIFTLKL